ncbi:DddA-like double-stranded DNA deaminase toxin [Micromonospora sp. HUAS LYJ1]|uniref:DddA-like double-stranded DNA deaminase toxin n=1 Tax=Micromonospora sp. HUAS LYJ1 TaxID=3061626 RepID=UPI0034A05C96
MATYPGRDRRHPSHPYTSKKPVGACRSATSGRTRPLGYSTAKPLSAGTMTPLSRTCTRFAGGGWPRVLVSHVESHVAARMRRDELDEGELVLNNTTCGTRDFDRDWPLTCDKLLPPVLPAGARLTVWATQDGGRTWWTTTYTGTGERIRS